MSMNTRKDEMLVKLNGVVTADQLVAVLRAGGIAAIEVEFVAAPWPHVALFVATTPDGDRRGTVTLECDFTPTRIEQVAKVTIIEDDGDDGDDDNVLELPPE